MRLLIVVDYQKDFITGPLGSTKAKDIYKKICDKVYSYNGEDDYVIFTRDTHYAGFYAATYEGQHLPILHCVEGTDGWQIPDTLYDEENDHHFVINKSTFGWPFWEATINDLIGIEPDVIEIIGVCTDICVVTNALMLHTIYSEAEISVDAACCAGTSDEAHKAALTVMKSCQIVITNE